uniref:Nucleoporin Nup37 n=1 Tax=Clastoptera arizonana TaxID=38151 RepID=A0A1B6DC57_9HEMI
MTSMLVDNLHSSIKIDNPVHVIDLPKQVIKVEFSPYEWSHNLIAIAYPDEINIGIIKFQEESEEMEEEIEFEILKSFELSSRGSRVHDLAWSPETSLNVIPKCLFLSCATSEFNILVYSTNMTDESNKQELIGHRNYINSISYESTGDYLASVSDDLTCRIWDVKNSYECSANFPLKSPGMSVRWHSEDNGKLLVGEKNGTIRVYNVERQQAILSFDTNMVPLMDADWSPSNCYRVAAIVAGNLVIWDTTRPSRPIESRALHPDGGRFLRYSPQSDHHIATIGQPDNTLKIIHTNMKHPAINATLKLAGGLTWMFRLPYICVGVDRSICLWKVATK